MRDHSTVDRLHTRYLRATRKGVVARLWKPGRAFQHRGTDADRGVMRQIFKSQDYSLNRLRRAEEIRSIYDRLHRSGQPPLILDAGANIGAASVYFSMMYPHAHVVALEPERNNFALLERNTLGLDIDARCVAIGSTDGEASLIDPGRGEWAYRTSKGAAGMLVPVHSASRLVAEQSQAGFKPFIAKIDIEGAEDELFSRNFEWVDQFPLLIIELHDWLLPGSGSSRNFLKCVAQLDRDFLYFGENVFSIKNDNSKAAA